MCKKATIFCDIDGTLVKHNHPTITAKSDYEMELLKDTLIKLSDWEKMGHIIILTTARKESMRSVTEKQLSSVGIFYDQLIMGIGSGVRYLINDTKEGSPETAVAFNTKRDEGLININIQHG